ncbi:uncharacterized protein LOC131225759 [Magnolia sinica]|uniref:uncharacterized protein LOC131225759 n=1 Tax=Magnolia sinica TaxID=86752 RepID=UPI0026596AAF|nr:uncharacterized protein LOC131225759 [Magnolia sinica]
MKRVLMGMGKRSLHLLVILLGFSHLIALNATPLTRTQKMLQDPQGLVASGNSQKTTTEEAYAWEHEDMINGRMDLESQDYPGSGANNRHTPRSPGGKN